jgi:hypothetical protein
VGLAVASVYRVIRGSLGKPIDHWVTILDGLKDRKHMERVAVLKADHKLGHGHANALVAHHRALNGET